MSSPSSIASSSGDKDIQIDLLNNPPGLSVPNLNPPPPTQSSSSSATTTSNASPKVQRSHDKWQSRRNRRNSNYRGRGRPTGGYDDGHAAGMAGRRQGYNRSLPSTPLGSPPTARFKAQSQDDDNKFAAPPRLRARPSLSTTASMLPPDSPLSDRSNPPTSASVSNAYTMASTPTSTPTTLSSNQRPLWDHYTNLSIDDLDRAKTLVLDLLGWGVEPEYLVTCGVSSQLIYRVFTDLNLRLPGNLSRPSTP
ncbi:hypothetical protein FA15DRAFT_701212 [Coprinopsis marcescibilis]|uniref:Uncharacterized protein n=1 Tax=Coprinopsis marcescibilis TaxID=230819 RepID=A0A5C3L8D5_COPMA|nr:hypothetical protein FA15DRAFT_701212 [Coprinopsis marcescibilis]